MPLSDEKLYPVLRAIELRIGRRLHPASAWRWRTKGVAGARLETAKVGGRRMTSLEAVDRFIEHTTAAADGEPVPTRTPRQRQRDIERAEAELADAGI